MAKNTDKEVLHKACIDYAQKYIKGHMIMPKTPSEVADWNKADFLGFRTRASKAVSQIDLDIKAEASKVSDIIYEELITSVGGEKV